MALTVVRRSVGPGAKLVGKQPLLAPTFRSGYSVVLREASTTSSSTSSTSQRFYPRPPGTPSQSKGVKIGYVFGVLANDAVIFSQAKSLLIPHLSPFLSCFILLGIGATSYGLYNFYSSFTAYPAAIRTHLRAALRSAATESYSRADASFAQAYQLALDDPTLGKTRQERLIKTTGIAIRWGAMWEAAGELGKAIEVYDKGFREIADLVDAALPAQLASTSTSTTTATTDMPTKSEIMRGAAIALKVGDLSCDLGGTEALAHAEERYAWALQELMRVNMTPAQLQQVDIGQRHGSPDHGNPPPIEGSEGNNDLPTWVSKVELVAAMERLGGLYARQGKLEYAQPLLQQAIATLLPPPSKDANPRKKLPPPSVADRCHAATLMNNLASAFVQDPSPSVASIDSASRWARQSLAVAHGVRTEMIGKRGGNEVAVKDREEVECELVALVGAYNLGKLAELAKDKDSARKWFEKSRAQAVRIGSRDGLEQSSEAIRRLGR
ncbi:BZ3500_MvSof-1268-A1-R1_Chr3-1g05612 [Microbotryum saponariae]|uniref:BZ3500_MvSof-1268-A1-R1_Chr3-1g05612 protein n=1 Tax=Microbotryum saponariae TaxID=289078 RepID=A0A2X0NBA4_9BASI|nr:BZ3500_MvSof-1268-A1-R1_Chr3-1g05612 [Microbotryum saponariae]SDA04802.1 BZ3501_MvSof-1269-A2-R1_Chr3-1g05282 [Microbotryum saponariae]